MFTRSNPRDCLLGWGVITSEDAVKISGVGVPVGVVHLSVSCFNKRNCVINIIYEWKFEQSMMSHYKNSLML